MKSNKKVLLSSSLKAGGWYLTGNLFNKALAFITIPIFTRLLSPYDYGFVNTYISWVAICSIFVGLSMENSIRTAYSDFKENINEFLSSVIILSLFNFIVLSVLVFVVVIQLNIHVRLILVILCLVQAFMTFMMAYISTYYMMKMEYVKNTLLLGLPNLIATILSIMIIKYLLEDNLYMGRIIPFSLVNTIFGTVIFIGIMKRGKKKIHFGYWKYALNISVPLIFHSLSISILAQSDRIIITKIRGPEDTGIYSLIYNFSMILTIFQASIDGVWIPWFMKKMAEGKKEEINERVRLYIDLMVCILVCLLCISPEVLKLMAPKEYWGGEYFIAPILLSSFIIFLYCISVNVEYYYKSTKRIAINTFIAAISNIILNLIFIPIYGVIAAAFTTLFCYCLSFVIHYKTAYKLDVDLFPFRIYIIPIIVVLIMSVLAYVFMNNTFERYLILSIFVLGYSIYIYNKYWHMLKEFNERI